MNGSREKTLAKMLSIIKRKPEIRPSEINRKLGIPHTANLRNTLIKNGLIRKIKKGNAAYYYPK